VATIPSWPLSYWHTGPRLHARLGYHRDCQHLIGLAEAGQAHPPDRVRHRFHRISVVELLRRSGSIGGGAG
jgi:hypothetical protein